MTIIDLTIVESDEEILPGIPKTISITASEPSTIFYTLDGTDPNTYSSVYMAAIDMPDSQLNVVLKITASNGLDNSAIITKEYSTTPDQITINKNVRMAHSTISNGNSNKNNNLFPFGDNGSGGVSKYNNPSNAGTTEYNPALPATATGFNADGYGSAYTNQNPNDPMYRLSQIYYNFNAQGENIPGIGNIPAKTTVIGKEGANEYTKMYSSTADKIFNPKAFVIFQDSTTEDPTNPPVILRSQFTTLNPETNDGTKMYKNGIDSQTTTGTYLKTYYNERTGMQTAYFFDSANNRWIMSSSPYIQTNPDAGNLSYMVFSRDRQSETRGPNNHGMVFLWKRLLGRALI